MNHIATADLGTFLIFQFSHLFTQFYEASNSALARLVTSNGLTDLHSLQTAANAEKKWVFYVQLCCNTFYENLMTYFLQIFSGRSEPISESIENKTLHNWKFQHAGSGCQAVSLYAGLVKPNTISNMQRSWATSQKCRIANEPIQEVDLDNFFVI